MRVEYQRPASPMRSARLARFFLISMPRVEAVVGREDRRVVTRNEEAPISLNGLIVCR